MFVQRILALLATALIVPAVGAGPTLRYSAVSSWNMPYGRFEGKQLVDGIMYDLAMAIGKQLQMPVTLVVLSRKRVERAAQNGDIDLRCYMTPEWTERPDLYVWSGKLFEITDVMFGGEATPPLSSMDAIPRGAIISTVLGYEYRRGARPRRSTRLAQSSVPFWAMNTPSWNPTLPVDTSSVKMLWTKKRSISK